MSPPTSDDELYEFAEQSPPPRAATKIKTPPTPAAGIPVILPYRARKEDKPALLETEQIKHVYMPLGLLAGGIFIELLSAIIWSHRIGPALLELTLDLTVGTGVMLLAMLIAAKIRGINLGKLGVATYKLAAISIAPAAATEFLSPILNHIPFGSILVFLIEFGLFFALLGALFDLDESDTWYCVCIMFVTRTALYFALLAIFRA